MTTPSGRRPKADSGGMVIWAARAVWIIANGDPGDLLVLHTCHRGDEGCINIRHLYRGDQNRNVQDMVEADRQARGERQGRAVLSAEQIRQMRQEYIPRVITQAFLANKYGISRSHVANILRGAEWKHVA
ncbi:helix-turn-helix domain-containing protein [Streptomyces sp. NPDC058231]|uniref:helix-turn-helix domain-containing protein n=1 Tax=Streptomyces sp. NPDC058231 TaxID=3346392 RepID=UPI0036E0569B